MDTSPGKNPGGRIPCGIYVSGVCPKSRALLPACWHAGMVYARGAKLRV